MTDQALIPYIRQSRKKEKTISLDEQRHIIERWAKGAGIALTEAVVEQGVSGSKPWRERALGDVIARIEAGEAGGIVVAFQDRLSRENGLGTAEVWEALDKARARLVAAAEGLDTATGDHELLFSIKAAIAREQWKRFRANWANARRNAVFQARVSRSMISWIAASLPTAGSIVPGAFGHYRPGRSNLSVSAA